MRLDVLLAKAIVLSLYGLRYLFIAFLFFCVEVFFLLFAVGYDGLFEINPLFILFGLVGALTFLIGGGMLIEEVIPQVRELSKQSLRDKDHPTTF